MTASVLDEIGSMKIGEWSGWTSLKPERNASRASCEVSGTRQRDSLGPRMRLVSAYKAVRTMVRTVLLRWVILYAVFGPLSLRTNVFYHTVSGQRCMTLAWKETTRFSAGSGARSAVASNERSNFGKLR